MCISAAATWLATNAATIGAVGGALGGVAAVTNATRSRPDPNAAQARADALAAQNANGRLAQRRKSLAKNSLVTGGSDVMSTGLLNGGKPTLGG